MTENWTDFAKNVNAAIDSLTGGEGVSSQQITSIVSTEISIRWRPGITPTMRVMHNGDVYNIVGALSDSLTGRKIITLLCTQRNADGFRDG